jgi:alkyl hydroperoxide reductase subunit AhpC
MNGDPKPRDPVRDAVRATYWEKEARRVMQIDVEMRTYFAQQFVRIHGGICPATWPHIKAAFEKELGKLQLLQQFDVELLPKKG